MGREAGCDVHGVGNAIVDLVVMVDDQALDALGVTKGHMTLVDDERQAHVLRSLDDKALRSTSGGSAANTVVGVAELGGAASYSCKVGTDAWGQFYVDDMRRVGVHVTGAVAAGRTGTCVVLVTPDAQRSMLTNLGVSADLAPADLDEAAIRSSSYLYIEGYLLAPPTTRAACLRAIEVAKSAGVAVALSVSDPFVVHASRDLLWDLVRGPVDLLFCNELEAKALTGADDPVDCAREIHRHASNVALTLGPKGSLLMHGDVAYPVEGVPVDAVDTTGAGDMYAAGLLYGLTHGLDWPTAGHLASHAAARVVEHLGARLPRRFTAEEMAELCTRR